MIPDHSHRRLQAILALLTVLVITFSGVCISLAGTSKASGMPVVVTVGDSNTELGSNPDSMGYQAMLSHMYIRKADVINRGFSGWNTRKWLNALPTLVAEWSAKPPSLVVVFLGTNGAALKDGTHDAPILHVSLEEYKANLEAIATKVKSSFGSPVLFVTPPACNDLSVEWRGRFSNAEAAKYAAAMTQVGATLKVPVVDVYTPTQQNVSSFFFDGLHLNRKGYQVVYERVATKILGAYPTLAAKNLPRHVHLILGFVRESL